MAQQAATGSVAAARPERIALKVLAAVGISHFLNDLIQSLIPAIYPLLKTGFQLSFTQIGLITLTFQMSASLLQPLVGLYSDRYPQPYSLTWGMGCTLIGLIALAFAPHYGLLLLSVAMIGVGSSVFHPESSRVARMASAGHYGLAQSIFQLGGNGGTSAGPLLAALIIIPYGRSSLAWFSLIAFLAMVILWQVGGWYARKLREIQRSKVAGPTGGAQYRSSAIWPLLVLLVLMFSKFFYTSSINSYLTFYLMHKFQVSMQTAQLHLFVFFFGLAVGTMLGGPIGDRIGRKPVIWWSIFGAAPFTLALPYASLFWSGPLTFVIGLLIASAFPAMVVYAQELFPGKVGMIAGLFFGLSFGLGGVGAALLGWFADVYGIDVVYQFCSCLPLLGLVAVLLPNPKRRVAEE
ncbi:MAG: MFS transporter [Desulfobulbus sp.]|nr:MFS transporter [Desulfobulbus sp.]